MADKPKKWTPAKDAAPKKDKPAEGRQPAVGAEKKSRREMLYTHPRSPR